MRHSLERRATEAAGKWPGALAVNPQSIVYSRYVLIEQRVLAPFHRNKSLVVPFDFRSGPFLAQEFLGF